MIPEKKGNKVLLIWPETDKGYNDLNPLGQILGLKGVFFPLPLLYVASALGADWEYTIVNEHVKKVTKSQVESADFFLISVNTLQRNSAERLVKELESFQKPIIIGGPVFFIIPEAFNSRYVTKVFGEIESAEESPLSMGKTVAEQLSADMKKKTLKPVYKAQGHPDITKILTPRYDLIKPDEYFYFSLQISRGCHNRCDFCQEVLLYGSHQRKHISQTIAELNMLLKLGNQRTVFIVDDNFIGNLKNPLKKTELINALNEIGKWQVENDYPFDFMTQCSIDIAEHDEIMLLMSKSGINIIFIGIETVNKRALSSVHKTQNINNDIVASIKRIQSYGFGVIGGLIIGFDEDTENTFDDILDFMRKSCIPYVGISLLSAPPGTKLYSRYHQTGRISKDTEALTKSFRTNIISKMHPISLYRGYAKIAKTIYNPREYFLRSINWAEGWNDSYVLSGKKGSLSPNLAVKRVLRSIIYQGILSNYRLQYWNAVIKTLIKFRTNSNKIALSLYLIYFYCIINDIINEIDKFTKAIPPEIIHEWENFNKN